jgi:outer membrane murein-binding lipoprotein Lpp
MSTRDDIEFDFFDEPETEEATERVRGPRKPPGGPQGPRRPTRPSGFIPMLRLAGLIAFLILAVVLLVVLFKGCASDNKHSAYRDYIQKVDTIASQSQQIGASLNQTLTATGVKESQIESKIDGLAAQSAQLADQAKAIDPPGPLRTEHNHLIEILQLRTSGLSRLADAFNKTATAKNATTAGKLLSDQVRLLTASDVNWDFYFREPTIRELKNQGVTGVGAVPDSNMVPNADLASTQAMANVWQRIHGAATGGTPGGSHGSALVSVTALPDGKKLDPNAENTVTASTDLAFQVVIQDSGDSQEFNITVTLTIQKSPTPIVKHKTIDIINAGEQKTVTFTDLGPPPFGVPTTVKVDVQPVPGEKNTANNSAEYRVIFSLG